MVLFLGRITQARGGDAGYSRDEGAIIVNKEDNGALPQFQRGQVSGCLSNLIDAGLPLRQSRRSSRPKKKREKMLKRQLPRGIGKRETEAHPRGEDLSQRWGSLS